MNKYRLTILTLFFFTSILLADKFEWTSVSDEDWDVTEDESANIRDAVMLFEQIKTSDDLLDQECYYELYRRIRILSPQGRKWGDVSIPYFKGDRDIKEIRGRTILRDGTIVELNESHIYEKEIIKTERGTVKQKSFYLPSITSDCIVEYYYKIKAKHPEKLWEIQKEIFLKEGKFIWDFYKGQGLSRAQFEQYIDQITPNYSQLNSIAPMQVQQLPNMKSPEKLAFSVKNVPAFEAESYTLPDMVFMMNVRLFYGGQETSESYWGNESKSRVKKLTTFTKRDDLLVEVVKQFENIESTNEKIQAAYHWIQAKIKNVNYEDDKDDYKDNEDVNDVIERRYGTSTDINQTFVDMLILMNIDAKLAWVVDRDEGLLEAKAKYWQFDRNLVAVEQGRSRIGFYRPASRFLPYGYLDWYNEGVDAFLIGSFNRQFASTPFSSSVMNKMVHSAKVKLDSALNASGHMYEKYTGHPARSLRHDLFDTTKRNQTYVLKKRARKLTPSCVADSFKITNIEEYEEPLKISYRINVPQIGHHDGKKAVIQPFRFIQSHNYGLFSEERKYPVLFNYAKEYTEIFVIDLPVKWGIQSVPEDSAYINSAGSIYVMFKILQNGKAISLQRLFKLKSPFFRASQYEDVKELMDAYKRFSNIPIILKEKSY